MRTIKTTLIIDCITIPLHASALYYTTYKISTYAVHQIPFLHKINLLIKHFHALRTHHAPKKAHNPPIFQNGKRDLAPPTTQKKSKKKSTHFFFNIHQSAAALYFVFRGRRRRSARTSWYARIYPNACAHATAVGMTASRAIYSRRKAHYRGRASCRRAKTTTYIRPIHVYLYTPTYT